MKLVVKITILLTLFTFSTLIISMYILLHKAHKHFQMLDSSQNDALLAHFDMALRETASWTLLILFVVISIASFLLARMIIKPMHILQAFALKLVKGERYVSLPSMPNDAIGQLGCSLQTLDKTLAQYEQSRNEMTQNLAHEIRNPLATLKSQLSAFEDGLWEVTPARLSNCTAELDRLIGLVAELDQLNVINDPKFTIERKNQFIAPIIEKTAMLYAPICLSKKMELAIDVAPHLKGFVDEKRLTQILQNIFENAIHAVESDGRIQCYAKENGQSLCIIIADTGGGSPTPEQLFTRYVSSTSSSNKGLGLTITKALVEAHQGTIMMKNNDIGGMTCQIDLPRHSS
ncbi:hypothetical protein QI30_02880 [Kurthia sp. 3B1D]|uniref:histidine kinase n=1 Tax=Candidatus Kurthia intestinigallinarum TaxID=1562256 RepID=A0A433RXS0_9BACL|nr:ATP-binding protein [Kurthia sp. 3B1D]RUS58106.1 hypothetical protein QI30_02880 [Kurthia sp. 3B1D]